MMDRLFAAAMDEDAYSVMDNNTMSWQETFRQLRDYHKGGNSSKSLPPRLVKWMDVQRRRYKLYGVGKKKSVGIITQRIAQLDSIGFDWFQGEEMRRPNRDPHPTVILPPSQRLQSSRTSQKIDRNSRPNSQAKQHVPIRRHHDNIITGHVQRGGNESTGRKQSLNTGFPEQLFRMVNDGSATCRHIIDWLPDGSAFEIFDTENIGHFIKNYFRHGKLSSLRRMMHLYQFTTSNNVFRHSYFHRDRSLADIKHFVVKR
jgi:hypothetical protein